MKSLRVRVWFKATPAHVVLDAKRIKRLGTKNLVKLMKVARKHKTTIEAITQPQIEKSVRNTENVC